MSKKDLLLNPHKVTNRFWWYEENSGIELYFETIEDGIVKNVIPWRAIRNALKRKDK